MTTITLVSWNTQTETTLADLLKKSQYTILYFYPKNDTPWCTVEANDFTERYDQFTKASVQVVWISRDTAQSHCNFIEKYWLRAEYISDPDLVLHKAYEAWWEKNNYWKIVTGVIRGTVLLDSSWEVIQHWKNVRAKGHGQRVLDFVLDFTEKL